MNSRHRTHNGTARQLASDFGGKRSVSVLLNRFQYVTNAGKVRDAAGSGFSEADDTYPNSERTIQTQMT